MKRYGNLYPQIYDFANLELAYKKARKCKRYRAEVLRFTERKEENLIDIQNHLIWKSYTPGEYRKFTVTEPKPRQIMALPFRDRVMQHALNTVIEPIFDRGFIHHSYACRKGKGMHEASDTLQGWLYEFHVKGKRAYCLKADISQYFRSIHHETLKRIVRRRIKCPDTLWLLDMIIDNSECDTGRGIPVGNLSSQLFANVYLNELDQYVKHKLRIRHYMRYMDDFIIILEDKEELRRVLADIRAFIENELHLTLNPKTDIFPVKNGVDFVGYRHFHSHRKVRKSSVKRMKRRARRYQRGRMPRERFVLTLVSWLGHIAHADTWNLRKKILLMIGESQ